jgi:hypothetical protein
LCRSALAREDWLTADSDVSDVPTLGGQARSYIGFESSPNFAFDATSVGAGLLANAVYQAMAMALADRVRGQARSYTGWP